MNWTIMSNEVGAIYTNTADKCLKMLSVNGWRAMTVDFDTLSIWID